VELEGVELNRQVDVQWLLRLVLLIKVAEAEVDKLLPN
jgi:hypothetical protein